MGYFFLLLEKRCEVSNKAEAKMQEKCKAGPSRGCIYDVSLGWHRDSHSLDKPLLWRGQGTQLSITCKSQRVLLFILQTSGCCLCGGSPPLHPTLLLAAACGHPTPAVLPAPAKPPLGNTPPSCRRLKTTGCTRAFAAQTPGETPTAYLYTDSCRRGRAG